MTTKIRKKKRGSQLVWYKNITLFPSRARLTIAQSQQNQRFICSKLACIKYIVSIFRQNIKVIFCTKIPLRKKHQILQNSKFKSLSVTSYINFSQTAVTPKQTDARHRQVFSHMVLCNGHTKVLKEQVQLL